MRWPLPVVLMTGVFLVAPEVATPETLRLEAERFNDSYNIGGVDISVHGCSAAFGGLAVDGLDVDGEWIKLPLVLAEELCFVDSLRSAGSAGAIRTFAIHIETTSLWAADTVTTIPGSGIT